MTSPPKLTSAGDRASPIPKLPESYINYLTRLKDSNSCFNWLHDFFEYKPLKPDCKIDILDMVGENIQRQSPDTTTLRNRRAEVQFRIVLLSYSDPWLLDRALLDSVCYTFDLDLIAVWVCFDGQFSHLNNPNDDTRPDERNGPLSRQLTSAGSFLSLSIDYYGNSTLFAVLANSRDQGPLDTRKY